MCGKSSRHGRKLFWQTSLPFVEGKSGKLQAGQSYLNPWEENVANLPEHHFWTHEGDKGDEMTGSVNKGMEVDVIYLDFGKAFFIVSQSIFSAYLGRYGLHMWKTSWTATLKELNNQRAVS